MPDFRKLLKAIIYFIVATLVVNVGMALWLLTDANKQVATQARALAIPVAREGCLPEGETFTFSWYTAGGIESTTRNLQLQTQYLQNMRDSLNKTSSVLGNYLSYENNAIKVYNVTGGGKVPAIKYDAGAVRGEPVMLEVTGVLRIPMFMYVGWKGSTLPTITVNITKKITVFSTKYQRGV